MSTWLKSPLASVHEYTAVRSSDEESNRPEHTESSALPKAISRLLIRNTRLLPILVFVGALAYLGSTLSTVAHLTTSEHNDSLPKSPSVDSDLEIHPGTGMKVDWSKFAYTQYVTNENYLCNSLMVFETLHRLGSKAERVMMYPEQWSLEFVSPESSLLRKAQDDYNAKLVPIHVQHLSEEGTWGDSFTKLLAFNQTQYERVISLDSDANVLQHMDELFFLPKVPVAMPRAYWLDNTLSSQLVVIEPSKQEFERILYAFEHRNSTDFDMEIVNNLYGQDCLILPHRRYDLLTGEFRSKDHHKYLGSTTEVWDPRRVLQEAKFLHFSDWPYPKPWIAGAESVRLEVQPACHNNTSGEHDCSDREVWNEIYVEFRERRGRVCGSNFTLHKRSEPLYDRQTPSPFEPIF
ncbi:nucleotide-diphospho-sugar transferase [Aureobasidium sp. EXF-10728]|nr:nucleotide-diphospho-sugar transferase [Aureobasidium sp. EXF-10728]